MAVVYTHSVFLRFLLIFVLLDVTGGIVSSAKGHFRRKDFPADKIDDEDETNNGTRKHQHEVDESHTRTSTKKKEGKDIYIDFEGQTITTVVLHCNTSLLEPSGTENITVIWVKIFNEGSTILTNGAKVLTADKRFVASNKVDSQDWSLYIRHAKLEDEGLYMCQICAHANVSNSIFVRLKLREAKAEIIGDKKKFVNKVGSPLRLSCKLTGSIEAPKYIYWYHGDRVINYDLYDGATVRDGRQGSELIFPRAQEQHAGNYSCVPSNAKPASVLVVMNHTTLESSTKISKKNSGEKLYPQRLTINMLVLASTFLLYR